MKLTYKLTYTALFAVIICLCAMITVPAAVPFTMQTFGVAFALLTLGGKLGTLSVLIYIALGAVGLPVFSGFSGGLSVLAGPTGGYIVGFVAAGIVYIVFEAVFSGKLRPLYIAAGMLVCYIFGTVWFCFVTGTAFWSALSLCVVPFIIPDAAKIALAVFLSNRLRRFVSRGTKSK